MIAIIKREIGAYFSSMVGYILLALFYMFSGYYFHSTSLAMRTGSLRDTYSGLFIILVLLIPVLTMRLISEEKKQKTDQLLFTAPVRLSHVALAKYFAALVIFLLWISITLIYAFVTAIFTASDFTALATNYLGLFLFGSALVSINLFLSAITEEQTVAAFSGIVIGVAIMMFDGIARLIPVAHVGKIFELLSFISHYKGFTSGIIKLEDVCFFVSVSVAFVFLTVRVFEKRRWS